jgi:hypothetical protein
MVSTLSLTTHVAGLCCSLMHIKQFEKDEWDEISNYWAVVVGNAVAEANIQKLRTEA